MFKVIILILTNILIYLFILLYISAVFEVLGPEIILVRGCKQVEAEVVSKSKNKLEPTKYYIRAKYSTGKMANGARHLVRGLVKRPGKARPNRLSSNTLEFRPRISPNHVPEAVSH